MTTKPRRFLRLKQIVGDLKTSPPLQPLIPVGQSTILAWVQQGKFPKPIKMGRCTVWREADVLEWIERDGAWPPENDNQEEAA